MKNILENIKNLDPNNPGLWPVPFQFGLGIIVMVVLMFAGWHFDLSKQRVALEAEQAKELEHKEAFDMKQRRAANLDALKEQMLEMEESFGDMLRQLPNETEIAGLIVDISQTGLAVGLEFDLFQPLDEVPGEFYARLPIRIRVRGNYHQFAEFVSGIAQLPRIVTTNNVEITKNQESGGLVMAAYANTYRALGEGE